MSWFERRGRIWIDGVRLNESRADLAAIIRTARTERAATTQLFDLVAAQIQTRKRRRRAHFNITNKRLGEFRVRIQAASLAPPDWAAIDLMAANIASKVP